MVTANCGKALSKAIAHNHIQADRMYKLLDLRINGSTCCWEEVGILKAKLLTYQREYGFIQELVLHMQEQWWALAF